MEHHIHPVFTVRSFIQNMKIELAKASKAAGRNCTLQQNTGQDDSIGSCSVSSGPTKSAQPEEQFSSDQQTVSGICFPTENLSTYLPGFMPNMSDSVSENIQLHSQNRPLSALQENLSSLEYELQATQSALDLNRRRGEAMSERMDMLEVSILGHNSYTKQLLNEGRLLRKEILLHSWKNRRLDLTPCSDSQLFDHSNSIHSKQHQLDGHNTPPEINQSDHMLRQRKQAIDSLITLISFNLTSFPKNLVYKTPGDIFESVIELATESVGSADLKKDVHLLVATAFASNWFTKAQRRSLRKYLLYS